MKYGNLQFIGLAICVIAVAAIVLLREGGATGHEDFSLETAKEHAASLRSEADRLEGQVAIARKDMEIAETDVEEFTKRLTLRSSATPTVYLSERPVRGHEFNWTVDRQLTNDYCAGVVRDYPAQPVRGPLSVPELERLLAEAEREQSAIPARIASLEFELDKARADSEKAQRDYEALRRSKAAP